MKLLLILSLLLFLACNKDKESHAGHDHSGHDHAGHDHSLDVHTHKAPYGGTLKELEGHKASLEWVLEPDSLTVYIHDGCAEKDIRVAHEKLEVIITLGEAKNELPLKPVVSELNGDKVGNASSFQIKGDGVKFDSVEEIHLKSIEIQGITYNDIIIGIKK